MSIERSRNRFRTPAPLRPRPDGISRRVATAARDRQLGPLPEQRPTGWHRLVYDNPPRPVPPALPEIWAGSTGRPAGNAAAPARPDRPIHPTVEVEASAVTLGSGPAPGSGVAPGFRAAAGSETGVTGHRAGPRWRQVGRVLDERPDRRRRWSALLAAALGAAAAAGLGVVLLIGSISAPAEPAPGQRPLTSPATTVVGPAVTVVGPAATLTDSPTVSTPPTLAPPVDPPGAAVVSTLGPGDPGFGWPSSAFGSGSAGN